LARKRKRGIANRAREKRGKKEALFFSEANKEVNISGRKGKRGFLALIAEKGGRKKKVPTEQKVKEGGKISSNSRPLVFWKGGGREGGGKWRTYVTAEGEKGRGRGGPPPSRREKEKKKKKGSSLREKMSP